MEKQLTKVYVTKYALTSGMFEAEMEVVSNGVGVKKHVHGRPEGYYGPTSFFGDDFWFTKEEAIKNCEDRRVKQIKSLQKKIEKLKKISFK